MRSDVVSLSLALVSLLLRASPPVMPPTGPPAPAPVESSAAPAPAASPDQVIWYQERRSDVEITMRLVKATENFEFEKVFSPSFCGMIHDQAVQACCSAVYVAFEELPALGAAAGPNVQVSAWHHGTAGYGERFGIKVFVAGASGTGKSSAARLVKKAFGKLEEKIKGKILTTGFTLPALKTGMYENGQVFAILEEVTAATPSPALPPPPPPYPCA